jgi:hypothetical protein
MIRTWYGPDSCQVSLPDVSAIKRSIYVLTMRRPKTYTFYIQRPAGSITSWWKGCWRGSSFSPKRLPENNIPDSPEREIRRSLPNLLLM